jgi:hypothetical protein
MCFENGKSIKPDIPHHETHDPSGFGKRIHSDIEAADAREHGEVIKNPAARHEYRATPWLEIKTWKPD